MHAITSLNLENIMLSERSQSPNNTYYMITFKWSARIRKTYRDRKIPFSHCLGLKREGGWEKWGVTVIGHADSF